MSLFLYIRKIIFSATIHANFIGPEMLTKINEIPIQKLLPFIKLFVFFISFTIHEVAHGYAALWCGDSTAKDNGRLSLSPFRHIDLVGSIIIPSIIFLMQSDAIIGWGKTVPVDFKKFSRQQHLIVSSAGVVANILLIVFGVVFFFLTKNLMLEGSPLLLQIFCLTGFMFIPVNAILALLNMIPLCPFDGWVFFYGFNAERKNINEKKVNPYVILANIAMAFIIIKVTGPWLIYGIKWVTYGLL